MNDSLRDRASKFLVDNQKDADDPVRNAKLLVSSLESGNTPDVMSSLTAIIAYTRSNLPEADYGRLNSTLGMILQSFKRTLIRK